MFKYYKISDPEIVEKIIGVIPTIKFSPASEFNDPFELKFNLKVNPNSSISRKTYFENFPDNTLEDYKSWQNGIDNHFIWYLEQEMRNTVGNIYSITSFSHKNNNNLMWSHYTNYHDGICVEYSDELLKFLKSIKGFLASGDVKYSKKPYLLNAFETNALQVIKVFFNKQSEWKYEKEFRVILKCDNRTEFIKINQSFIKSVFIGSRCNPKISDRVIEICKKTDIKIYHAITLGKDYEIKFEEHKEGTIYMKSFW
jgi:hypothetical protein